MNIAKFIVTSANWDVGRGGHPVTGIVLHTMVGTTAGAQARFSDPNSQVSVHYGVSLDGSIHQWVAESNTAYQAGNYPVNQTTIGIEHEDNGNANDPVRTTAEYESSSDLVADICKRYNIPCDTNHILLHKNVIDKTHYPGGTACPDGLDTNKIISMAQAKIGGTMNDNVTAADLDILRIIYACIEGGNFNDTINAHINDQFLLKNLEGAPLRKVIRDMFHNSTSQTYQAAVQKALASQGGVTKQSVLTYINGHLT